MYYIRLVIAFAAMVLSFVCFENADITAAVAEQPVTAVQAVQTAVMSDDTAGAGVSAEPDGYKQLSAALMKADVNFVYDDEADIMSLRDRSDVISAQEAAEIEQHEALLRAIQERIRKEEEQEAEKRRIAEKKAAVEAARKAACPGYDAEFVATLTKEEQAEARYFYEQGFVFYRQNWSVLDDAEYGNEGFGLCGCGPTCIAAIISNLAGVPVDPEEMRVYGLSVGSWVPSGGTSYGFLIETAKKYGITATQICASDREALFAALKDENKLVLATMGPGDFTYGAHFMLFRGMTDEGKILIADSYSYEYSTMEWDYDYLYAQLKNGYWIFEKAE